MRLGDKAKEVAMEHVKQKAARDILNGIKEWRANRIATAKRRWIFELIQNAVDTAKARGKDDLKIKIKTGDNFVKFRHDGGYFALDEISAVIYGGSRKPYAPGSEYIGRFGTGFLVTHVVNRKVKVKGFASEDGKQIYEFEIEIDRESDDERDISKNIEKCFSQLNNAKLFSSSESTELHTEFTYTLTDDLGKEALEEGIEELRNNIPFVLTFNEIIEEVVIDGEVFRKEVQKVNNSISKVIVNGRAVYIKEDDENGFQVAILINNGAISNLKGYPKIFIGMPLIETADYINIPFAINSVLFDWYCPKSCVNSLAIKLLWLILLITSEFNKKEGG